MNNKNFRAVPTSITIKFDNSTDYNFLLNFKFLEGH